MNQSSPSTGAGRAQTSQDRGSQAGETRGQHGNALGEQRGSRGAQTGQAHEERGRASTERSQKGNALGEQRTNKQLGTTERNERLGTRDRNERLGTTERNERLGTRERDQRLGRGERDERSTSTTTRTDRGAGFAREHGARSVQLNTEQRSRIHDVFVRDRSRFDRFRVSRVDFDVRPGVRIPRHVHLFSVPSDIVSVVPAYRGYRFFYYEDELVIVDPVTLEIVAVIPA